MNTTTKYQLGFFPTPLHELKNLAARFEDAFRIFIKRDDHTGLATGGNKTRKLEYLLGDALAKQADTIITAGAQQSNHCRQTAAACAQSGLSCHLLLGGDPPEHVTGNLLLSKMTGAHIHYTGDRRKGEDLDILADQLRKKGRNPYVLPYGGSNLIGAMGYVEAAGELKDQLAEQKLHIDHIFFASSSGGMQAGLLLGIALHGLDAQLMPIRIDKADMHGMTLREVIQAIVSQGNDNLKLPVAVDTGSIYTIDGYEEAGYGVLTNEEKGAILTLARTEGILLDPVYTGRAFHGMLDHLENQRIKPGSNVLFWHTGGIPANFQYANLLSE